MKHTPFLAQYGSAKHLDEMFEKVHNFGEIAAPEIVRNPFATGKHLSQVKFGRYNWTDMYELTRHPNLPVEHKRSMLKSPDSSEMLVSNILRRPDITKDDLISAISARRLSGENASKIFNHRLADKDVLDAGLNHSSMYVRRQVLRSDNINVDRSHVEKMLNSPEPLERIDALEHHHATTNDTLKHAYHDPDARVRSYAAMHPEFPIQDLKKIYHTDPNEKVKVSVMNRLAQYGEKL